MTPEEIVNQYYWWVLSRIKTELLTSPTGKPIRYELSHVGAAGVPNNQTEENILRKLNEWSAIKIVNEIPRTWQTSHMSIFEFEVRIPLFNQIYDKYLALSNPESKKKTYEKLLTDLSIPTLKTILEILEEIEKLAETTPTGQPFAVNTAEYRSDGYNEISLIEKLEEWEILTTEGQDDYGHPIVFATPDSIRNFKAALTNIYQRKTLKKQEAEQAIHPTVYFSPRMNNPTDFKASRSQLNNNNADRVNNLVCGNLRIDLEQGTICYGNNNPIEISPSNNIVKFLVILMRGGKAIEYVEIAKQT
ncbi:MAG: hypothetical protein UV55_C0011G0030 [Candidatus Gottesmanbacteria bacterium GW2011_GWC1_43_10]|nr:MAG: hypothetical protein UV55_C0011G0030 [Candidatus Gottesmanbacteria bacterium GW2011_GWC1_43_10]